MPPDNAGWIKINVTKPEGVSMEVQVKLTKQFRLRVWVGLRLLQLAAAFLNANFTVHNEEEVT